MQRDEKPLTNIGYGLTSRDVELDDNQNEEVGPSPNSGYISRKLHGHPFAKFLATNVGTVLATGVASMLVRKRRLEASQNN